MTLEEAVAEYQQILEKNIATDEKRIKALAEATNDFAKPEHKRERDRLRDRQQVQEYKLQALRWCLRRSRRVEKGGETTA